MRPVFRHADKPVLVIFGYGSVQRQQRWGCSRTVSQKRASGYRKAAPLGHRRCTGQIPLRHTHLSGPPEVTGCHSRAAINIRKQTVSSGGTGGANSKSGCRVVSPAMARRRGAEQTAIQSIITPAAACSGRANPAAPRAVTVVGDTRKIRPLCSLEILCTGRYSPSSQLSAHQSRTPSSVQGQLGLSGANTTSASGKALPGACDRVPAGSILYDCTQRARPAWWSWREEGEDPDSPVDGQDRPAFQRRKGSGRHAQDHVLPGTDAAGGPRCGAARLQDWISRRVLDFHPPGRRTACPRRPSDGLPAGDEAVTRSVVVKELMGADGLALPALVRRMVPGIEIFGGVTQDLAVGGVVEAVSTWPPSPAAMAAVVGARSMADTPKNAPKIPYVQVSEAAAVAGRAQAAGLCGDPACGWS